MNLGQLKKFAQNTRLKLISQIESRLDYAVSHDDEYLRAHVKEKKIINERIKKYGREHVVEETAYIWFNRFTAIRYMDNRNYNSVRILSPSDGEVQPQIMAEIKGGRFPDQLLSVKNTINSYLDGRIASRDPDREIYKTALLAWCNHLGSIMPYMFSKVDDWAALLLPLDLLSPESVIADFQKNITPDDCADVEIIGWLYQYYISGKKDDVFEALKKNKKITPDDIPAATQLFTPHWIVRYMTDNSLGRLYLENNPQSSLRSRMEYYIENEKPENFIKIGDPEEIRVMDPCCGSGHILVYAFDLLYMMYEESGYSHSDIPALIIKNNLFGIDIDDRASSLASFALVMKGREKDRSFLEKNIYPNIIALKEISRDPASIGITMSSELKKSFSYLKEAKNFGSLIPVSAKSADEIDAVTQKIKSKGSPDFIEEEVLEGLSQLKYLSPRYHCVITNPPYMGGKGMNARLSEWVKSNYPDSKSDLFAMFIERGFDLIVKNGFSAMVTMQSWMFLSSYEKLRERLLNEKTIECMVHMANMVMGIAFGTAATVWRNIYIPDFKGAFCFVEYEDIGNDKKPISFPPDNERNRAAMKVEK